jgi:hypothetical protein
MTHTERRAGTGDAAGRRVRAAPGSAGCRLADVLRDPLLLGFARLSLMVTCVYMQAYTTLPLAVRASGRPVVLGRVPDRPGRRNPAAGHRPSRPLAIGRPALWLTGAGVCALAAAGQLALGPAIRRRSHPA